MIPLTPLKYVATLNAEVLPDNTQDDFSFRYIDISAISAEGRIAIPAEPTTFADAPSRARRLAPPSATVVSTVRTYLRAIARVPEVDEQLVFSTGFAVLVANADVDPSFLYYACRSQEFVEKVVAHSTGVSYPAISPGDLGEIGVRTPRLDVQRRVARFLDDQTARIEVADSARRRQVPLLEEAADSFASELLHQAAASAGLVRLGRLISVRSGDGLVSADFIDDGDFKVIGGNGVSGSYTKANAASGAVVVGRVGALCGNVHLLAEPSWVTDNALVVEARDVVPEYLAFILTTARLNDLASRTAQPLLTGEVIKSLLVPVPDPTEQLAISRAWSEKTDLTKEACAQIGREVALLDEFKQSLVTAAVSGDFDVSAADGSGVRV